MKIVVCPDSFKGTVSSARAASIIRSAALSVFPEAEVVTEGRSPPSSLK
ncbi:MAG: glycerate kinase [Clostridia bacterium]|nr:glycerate kinase [Clostridia bacterium]